MTDVDRGTTELVPPDDVHPPGPHPAGEGASRTRRSTRADLDRIGELLTQSDRAVATAVALVRRHRHHTGRDLTGGLPLDRWLSLATGRTKADVRAILRAERALTRMPNVDQAFAEGRLSWSQVRAIVSAGRTLSVRQLGILDEALADTIGHDDPDRIGRRARAVAGFIWQEDNGEPPDAAEKAYLRIEPDLFGGAHLTLYDRIESVMTIAEAAEAAADRPIKAAGVGVDADGNEVPAELLPSTVREAQLAEGLRRVAASYLRGGTNGDEGQHGDEGQRGDEGSRSGDPGRPARPSVSVVIDITDVDGAVARLLARWHGGPIPLTPLTTERILCDADATALVVDAARPVAITDAEGPITTRHYRSLRAIDRGCRMPGCDSPAQHADAHHVVPRGQGGETSVDNLVHR